MIKQEIKGVDTSNKIILTKLGREMLIKAFSKNPDKLSEFKKEVEKEEKEGVSAIGNYNYNLFKFEKKKPKFRSNSYTRKKPRKLFNRTMNIRMTLKRSKRHKSEPRKRRPKISSWLGKNKTNFRDSFMPIGVKKHARRPFIEEKLRRKRKVYEQICKTLENSNKNVIVDKQALRNGDLDSSNISQIYYNNRRLAYHHNKNAIFFKKMRKNLFKKAARKHDKKSLEFDRKKITEIMQYSRVTTDKHMAESGAVVKRTKALLESIHCDNTKKFWNTVKADRIHTHPTNYANQEDVDKRTIRKPEPIEYPIRIHAASSYLKKRSAV